MSARFHAPDPPRAGRYELRAEEARHLARVCRYAIGDRVEIFDGDGFVTEAEVVEIARDRVELVAVGPPILEEPPACPLTLATAMPKGERLDWLVEKATEVGVSRLVPLITERSVVDPHDQRAATLVVVTRGQQLGRLFDGCQQPWYAVGIRSDRHGHVGREDAARRIRQDDVERCDRGGHRENGGEVLLD